MPTARPLVALACATLAATFTALAGAQPVGDHLKCYKIKDPQQKATYTADLGGLVPEPGCQIKVPAVEACVPATKTNVTPPPPGGAGSGTPNTFFCYRVKCLKATLPALGATDQFGSRTVTPKRADLLCAPQLTTTTFVTTTTQTLVTTTTQMCTTTTTRPPCNLVGGICDGGCPGGQSCQMVAGGGCGCVGPPPLCSNAGDGFCAMGACPSGQTCQIVMGAPGCGPHGCQCQ